LRERAQRPRALESGQRISRIGQDGERYFLDEQQVAQETERARAGRGKELHLGSDLFLAIAALRAFRSAGNQ
jgi:hypothetical protein